jgi:hypothetical protein
LPCVWCYSSWELNLVAPIIRQIFYSSRLGSYTLTQGTTSGPRVDEILYHIWGLKCLGSLMLMQAAHGAPHPVSLTTWCAVCSVAPSYQIVPSANRAHERSAAWHYTIAQHCSTCLHSLQAMMTLPARTTCWHLGNVRVGHGNM